MVFALAGKSGELLAIQSAVEASLRCKGADVRSKAWLFFADDGSPLEARFERPGRDASAGAVSETYLLQRAMSGLWLQERLDQVRKVEGCGLTAVAELVELLKVNRSKRIAPGARGR